MHRSPRVAVRWCRRFIDSVQDPDGHVVMRAPGLDCSDCGDASKPPTVTDGRAQIADPDSVFQLITMMQGVVQRGTGIPAGKGLNRPIAGKTGTTQDFTDAWFSGFTPDLVTAVWVGFDNPASLGDNETGAAVAAPIWHDYMALRTGGPASAVLSDAAWGDDGALEHRYGNSDRRIQGGSGSGGLGADGHGSGQCAVVRWVARTPSDGARRG